MQVAFNPRPTHQGKKSNTSHKSAKHQNEKTYKLMFNPHLIGLQEKSDVGRLCKLCYPKIAWKLHFGKYKPKTQAGKCNICDLKIVVKAYRHVCDACCDKLKVCSKCGVSCEETGYHEESIAKKSHVEVSKEENAYNFKLTLLAERSRRKIMRLREDSKVVIREDKFWNIEHDREVSLLHWKKNKEGDHADGDEGDEEDDGSDDDLGSDMDFDDSDDESDEKPAKKGNKPVAKPASQKK
jgi:Uncharacterized conserved protein (DUF2039)